MHALPTLVVLSSLISPSALGAQDAGQDRSAEREAAFAKKMSGCKMVGTFTVDGRPQVGEARNEEYTIARVEKLEGDKWTFYSKIEYAKRKWTMPVTVSVKWAGDTPVIQVTKLWTPSGTYTARVLIYETHYAGFWSGGKFGGHMYGRIKRASQDEARTVQRDADNAKPAKNASGAAGAKATTDSKGKPAGKATNKAGKEPAADAKQGESSGASEAKPAPAMHVFAPELSQPTAHSNWPQFRGAHARGFADAAKYPAGFEIEKGKNLLWRVPVPGMAHSSPVLWGDRVYLTSAVPESGKAKLTVGLYGSIVPVKNEGAQSMRVLCFDRRTGEQLWTQTAWTGVPAIPRHPKGSHAASTPATDGKHVVALFASEGLYCYSVEGKLLWKKSLGVLDAGFFSMPKAQWGYAASPVIFEGKVIVQCDVQAQSFVIALDVETGEEIWKTLREEVPTWGTPTVDIREGRRQILVNGWKHIGGYDLDTGKELWKCVGGGDIPVPTPIVHGDIAFITNAHGRNSPILAIRTDASGEFGMDPEKSEQLLWSWTRRGNYMQTPLAYGNELYCCNDAGVIRCIDARTGEERYRKRIGGGRMGFTASPILADGKIYYTSEDGEVHTIKPGIKFERLALSDLEETCMATPAASRGTLFFRTRSHLVAIHETF